MIWSYVYISYVPAYYGSIQNTNFTHRWKLSPGMLTSMNEDLMILLSSCFAITGGFLYHSSGNSGTVYLVLQYLCSSQECKMLLAVEMCRVDGASVKPMQGKHEFCSKILLVVLNIRNFEQSVFTHLGTIQHITGYQTVQEILLCYETQWLVSCSSKL
jgi:hypothetical protein